MEKQIGDHNFEGSRSGSWYSRGKLLVTGEYIVLKGSKALALPAKLGQKLEFHQRRIKKGDSSGDSSQAASPRTSVREGITSRTDDRILTWRTLVKGDKWFEAVFRGPEYTIESASHNGRAGFLRHIMVNAIELSDSSPVYGEVTSNVEFDIEWGLGSSSSLISNVAYIFDINPFALHFAVSKGSGYDIACARSDKPLVYHLEYQTESYRSKRVSADHSGSFPVPVYETVDFNPPFSENLFFAYTGKKQDTAMSVDRFLAAKKPDEREIERVSEITSEILRTKDIDSFTGMLKEHDNILSNLLGETALDNGMFSGFPGYVKSLGAWGGDFVLIAWKDGVDMLKPLLKQKGIDVVFPYKKLAL